MSDGCKLNFSLSAEDDGVNVATISHFASVIVLKRSKMYDALNDTCASVTVLNCSKMYDASMTLVQ